MHGSPCRRLRFYRIILTARIPIPHAKAPPTLKETPRHKKANETSDNFSEIPIAKKRSFFKSNRTEAHSAAAARFWALTSCFLSFKAMSPRRLLRVPSNHESMPPLCSTERIPRAVRRIEMDFPKISDGKEQTCKFGCQRRRVLLFAWLTLLPKSGFFPLTEHTRAIILSRKTSSLPAFIT